MRNRGILSKIITLALIIVITATQFNTNSLKVKADTYVDSGVSDETGHHIYYTSTAHYSKNTTCSQSVGSGGGTYIFGGSDLNYVNHVSLTIINAQSHPNQDYIYVNTSNTYATVQMVDQNNKVVYNKTFTMVCSYGRYDWGQMWLWNQTEACEYDIAEPVTKLTVYVTYSDTARSHTTSIALSYPSSNLTIDPNGGTYGGTTDQTHIYSIPYNTGTTLSTATRTGYTFNKWELPSDGSAITNGVIYLQPKTNTTIKAIWTPNNYNVTYIDRIEGTTTDLGQRVIAKPYDSTVQGSDIGSNSTLGYYYSGYVYSNCTSAIVGLSGTTVYRYFNYPFYSVIHQQEQLDGTYKTVETEKFNSPFGSTVTPSTKSYNGFESPSTQSLVVKADGSASITYKYKRLSYNLKVIYNNNTSNEENYTLKYEETKDIETPEYTGYTLNNWGVVGLGSSITNTADKYTFKMGYDNAEIKANWDANEYTVNYSKGNTNDIIGSTQSTTHKFNSDVVLANSAFKGREYELDFDTNESNITDTGDTSGNKVITGKASSVDSMTGYLKFKNWYINDATPIASNINKSYDANTNLGPLNFTNHKDGLVDAIANWNSTTLTDWETPVLNGYTFTGWFTDPISGSEIPNSYLVEPSIMNDGSLAGVNDTVDKWHKTVYAHWSAIEYMIKYHGNNNWNTDQADYVQSAKYNLLPFVLTENKFNRNSTENMDGYAFNGWSKTQGSWNVDWSDKQSINTNMTASANSIIDMYAVWSKNITLTFNMNGGEYKGDTNSIKLDSTIYNDQNDFNFNIVGESVESKENYYKEQSKQFNAYGTYNSDNINSLFTKTDANGNEYRFLGWSIHADSTSADSGLIAYSTEHDTNYKIQNSTTLYAVWEPILRAAFRINRTLGDMKFSDGSNVVSSLNNLSPNTIDTAYKTSIIINAGEQGVYSIYTLIPNTTVDVLFDTSITDIYTHKGIWTDELNPSTSEDLVASQGQGLDRHIEFSESNAITRKFYIPQYLGTSSSYNTSKGKNKYSILFKITCTSKLNSKSKSEIYILTDVYIPLIDSSGNTVMPTKGDNSNTNNTYTILNELKSKLRVKLK